MGFGFGSNATEHFNKIAATKRRKHESMHRNETTVKKEEVAKRMKPLKKPIDVSKFPKGKSVDWYKENGYL